jgi:predicted GNAT family acetyltransferase
MKSLNDMFSEENKKKPHLVKEGEGADDKKYVRLMEQYKRARRGDAKEANKILEKAQKLAKEGDVSKKGKIAGAYI